jgi:hypothetical protein
MSTFAEYVSKLQTARFMTTQGTGRTVPEHFDPDVLDAFRGKEGRFKEAYENLQE